MSARASNLTPTFHHRLEDTIVAQATRSAPSARAILRISGPEGWPRIRSRCVSDAPWPETLPRRRWFCRFQPWQQCEAIPITVLTWPGPRSYTGQDLIELHLPGSPALVEVLFAWLLQPPLRLAEPGEFTLRAFLAGKLNLLQAEAVHGLIEAQTQDQWRAAMDQLTGRLTSPLASLRERLLQLLAEIEAGLDFAEEDLSFLHPNEVQQQLAESLTEVDHCLREAAKSTPKDRPFRVVLAGSPNAGKSSLFNALLRRHAALVSPHPGTTRDYLEAAILIDEVPIELVDTAGLAEVDVDDHAHEVDQLAQQVRGRLWSEADLILLCVASHDTDKAAQQRLEQEVSCLPIEVPVMRVLTKADLGTVEQPGFLSTSMMTGQGLAELQSMMLQQARRSRTLASGSSSLRRCLAQLATTKQHLEQCQQIILLSEPAELMAFELRLAVDALGQIVGTVYSEDLLDRVFSRFCIGK